MSVITAESTRKGGILYLLVAPYFEAFRQLFSGFRENLHPANFNRNRDIDQKVQFSAKKCNVRHTFGQLEQSMGPLSLLPHTPFEVYAS